MMWFGHAASGLAAGAWTLPAAAQLGLVQGPGERLAYVAAFGGAALLPDWDHPSSSMTVMWGPVSRTVHRLVHTVFRGHRAGTHDWVVAPILFGGLAWAASLNRWTSMLMLAVVVGATLRALAFVIPGHKEKSWPINLAVSAAAGWAAVEYSLSVPWLPVAVGLGVLLHIGGDAITRSGVPRPLSWLDGVQPGDGYRGGPISTGRDWREWVVVGVLLVVACAGVLLWVPELHETVATTN